MHHESRQENPSTAADAIVDIRNHRPATTVAPVACTGSRHRGAICFGIAGFGRVARLAPSAFLEAIRLRNAVRRSPAVMVPLDPRTRWTAATNVALIESALLTTDVGMGRGAAATAASSRVAADFQMISLATLSLLALSTAAASAAILQRLSRPLRSGAAVASGPRTATLSLPQ